MGDDAFCPRCPPRMSRDGTRRFGESLVTAENNYSGTGVDLMTCPACKTDYFVSYRIDRIEPVE